MGLFDIFRRKRFPEQELENTGIKEQNLPEGKEPGLVDQSNPGSADRVLTVQLPMEEIYKYLQVDYETRGYEDALSNPDVSYRDMNKKLIISNLKVLFKKVKQIYVDDLNKTEFHISSRSQAGLIDLVALLKNRKDMLDNHMTEILKMEKDLENGEDYMVGMLLSYERGFLKGFAALSLETLNIKR